MHAGETLQRDSIAERLWPMRPPGRGRRCLSTTLWRLRRTLDGPATSAQAGCISADRDTIRFERITAYWFDVDAFERKAAAGLQGSLPCDEARARALREALELYRGDLLEDCYDDWCLAEREKLRLLLLRVLKRLQRQARLSGDFELAIAYGERLLSLDSLQEDVHRELMRCHVDAGRQTRALEHFRRCRKMFNAELHVEPMRETWELYHQIRADRSKSASVEPHGGSLASLESALTQFDRALVALRYAQEALQKAAAEFGLPRELLSVTLVYPERD
jgi:DNA-binding SARP family transcriptional activator